MHSNPLAGVMAAALTLALAALTVIAQVNLHGHASPKGTESAKPKERTDALGDPLPQRAIARLGTVRLRGCRGPILFSPDGKHIVTVDNANERQAVFWDRDSGRRVKAFTTKEEIFDLMFSPDGKKLIALGYGGLCNSAWDVATGKTLFEFKGKTAAFRDGGRELISTFPEGERTRVRTFDVVAGQQLTEWKLDHPSEKEGLVLSADGRFAVFPSEQAPIRALDIFDLAKRTEAKRLRLDQKEFRSIGFSRDGLRLSVGGQEGLGVWEWSSGKVLLRWKGKVRSPAAFSPDGQRIAWIGMDADGVNRAWVSDVDLGRPRPIRIMAYDGWGSSCPAFSPDGKSVALITRDDAVVLLDSRTGRDQLPIVGHDDGILKVEYSSDGRHVLTRDWYRLLVWEAATGRLLRRLPDDLPEGETILLNTLSHGRIITATLADGALHLRDAATAKGLRRLEGKDGYAVTVKERLGGEDGFVYGGPWDVSAVSQDGGSAAILGPAGIRIYDLHTGAIRCQFTRDHPIGRMEFSADGSTVEVTIQDPKKGQIPLFYDTRTGRKVEAPADAGSWKRPDWRWQDDDEKNLSRLRELKLLEADGRPAFAWEVGAIFDVYESSDGRYLAVEGRIGHAQDGEHFVRLWNTETRHSIMELDEWQGLRGFSPDGRTLVTTHSLTGTIHLWESATGRERLRFTGHMPVYITAGFRPDGRALVSGGMDTQAFLWDVTGHSPDGLRHERRHSPETMRALCQALAGDDAAEAYRAMWALVDAPAQTVPWMREQLPPIVPVERRKLMRWLADLDSDEFAVRNKASEELESLGELAETALRDTLAAKPSLECRRRCEALLEKTASLSSSRLRSVRAIETLEHVGTTEARTLLEELGRGAPEARQTQEASAALKRLQQVHQSRDR
jgi:WD40 repeat protein